jgi:hypothetical protein
MSDYLNSLVSRTLRLGPVVQPRLASFFEPVSPGPANAPAMEVSETRSPRETFAPPTAERPDRPMQNHEANVESRSANEPAGVVLQSRPLFAPLLPAPSMPPPVLPINDTEGIREVFDLPPHAAEADSPAIEKRDNATPSRIKPEVRIVSAASDRDQSQSLTAPASSPIVTYAAPPVPSSPVGRVNTQAPAEPPETVVVTIGRVDVRAVFAPPQPAPRSNRVQQQAMSLDEYLKQRSEGRR